MKNLYFISRNYVEFGPLFGEEITDFKRRNILADEDHICGVKGQDWVSISEWIPEASAVNTTAKKKPSLTAKKKSPAQKAAKQSV